jgi:hypothetical protein
MKHTELAEALGFEEKNGFLCGVIDGMDAHVTYIAQGVLRLPALVILLDRILIKDENKLIKNALKFRYVRVYPPINGVVNQPFLLLTFMHAAGALKAEAAQGIRAELSQLIALLKEKNYHTPTRCLVCKQEMGESPEYGVQAVQLPNNVILTHVLAPIHKACLEQENKEQVQAIEEANSHTDRYPLAYVLSVIFMIVAIGINYAILLGIGYLFGLVYALIGLGGFLGFKLAKAPFTKKHIFILGGIATVLFVGSFLFLMHLLALGLGVTFSAAFSEFVTLVIQVLLFYALGLGISISVMWRQTKEFKLKRYGK